MLTIEFLFTKQMAVDSTVEVTKAVTSSRWMLPAIGFFAVLTAIWMMYQESRFSAGLGTLVFGLFMLSVPLLTRLLIMQRAKSFPAIGQTIQWTFDEEKLVSETVGARSEFVWSKLILVRETKKGFLLFPQPRLAHWIPRTAFKNQEEIGQLKTLVKDHNIPFKLA
ncbi:YcxB family protein [Verrucomicrobium sp. BvORR106]|uniref:YcxB family protein n=1 Tax=Verrucomicrobium sp. BvORR106 TaxID=1403819 RepID=UPI002240F292|nr:YcxB family protein [Verrucomicrobium sp. BvORR106]